MRALFNSPFKITQAFGVNKAYYSQFGLQGHEGLDLVPTSSDWSVLALEDGVVVKDDDIAGDPRYDAYGKSVTLWHPSVKKATMYCHLASNNVSLNQEVKRGQVIGVMGSTGNSSGAHVHLNLFDVDDNGIRLNKTNGFLGGINPEPFLTEGGSSTMVQVEDAKFKELVSKATKYDAFVAAGFPEVKVVQDRIAQLEQEIQGQRNANDAVIKDRDAARVEVESLKAQIVELERQISAGALTPEQQTKLSLFDQLKAVLKAIVNG